MTSMRASATLLLLLAGSPMAAQPSVTAGARVRVLVSDTVAAPEATSRPRWTVGTVVSSTSSVLVLRTTPSGPQQNVSFAELRRIEVSRGRSNHRWIGATIGGLISGGAFVAAACAFSDGSCSVSDNVGGFLGYYAVGAIPGAIVGGAIGSRHYGRERWRQIWP